MIRGEHGGDPRRVGWVKGVNRHCSPEGWSVYISCIHEPEQKADCVRPTLTTATNVSDEFRRLKVVSQRL